MHQIQQKIISLLRDQGSIPLKYREIGRRIGEKYPQTVKHHLEALFQRGLVVEQNEFIRLNQTSEAESSFVNLPFYGMASCGSATALAEDRAEGYIKVSKNIFPRTNVSDFYLVRADGNSMNQASVGRRHVSIDDGDLVVIDGTKRNPTGGEYVLSVIDECANIKRFEFDEARERLLLSSESSDEYFPIVIHPEDNYHVMGEVVDVIKLS